MSRLRITVLAAAALLTVGTAAFCLALPAPSVAKAATTKAKQYVLSEYNGQLAIFEVGLAEPLLLLEVQIDSLPERDIRRIQAGISADSVEEALSFAEDYE